MGKKTVKQAAILLFCLLTSFLALLFASSASPLYATNFWTDTNIYFTIGRGIRSGLIPYRDLFDHKGPLLYLLYGLAACFSDTCFIGVFFLEVLSLAFFFRLAFGFAQKTGARWTAMAVPPLAAIAVCGCRAFTQGGSAEEFCLPFLLLGILSAAWLVHPEIGKARDKMQRVCSVCFGISAAFVFLVKYTDIGLFAGLSLFLLLCLWRVQGHAAALRMLLEMFLGFLILCIPVFGVYALKGALPDCLHVYFYENLASYSGTPMSLRLHLWNAFAYLRTQSQANPILAGLTILGIIAWMGFHLHRGGRGSLLAAFALPAGAGCLLLTCFWGEMAHPYYALVFAATAVPGLCALLSLPERLIAGRSFRYVAALFALILMAGMPFMLSMKPEMRALRSVRKEEMPQVIFAGKIRDSSEGGNPTLLDLTSLDQGFYLAAGVLPSTRFFADNNLETQEKREAINGYLADAVCEYVVTVWREPGENYECIAEATGLFDLANERTYRLWRRKTQ